MRLTLLTLIAIPILLIASPTRVEAQPFPGPFLVEQSGFQTNFQTLYFLEGNERIFVNYLNLVSTTINGDWLEVTTVPSGIDVAYFVVEQSGLQSQFQTMYLLDDNNDLYVNYLNLESTTINGSWLLVSSIPSEVEVEAFSVEQSGFQQELQTLYVMGANGDMYVNYLNLESTTINGDWLLFGTVSPPAATPLPNEDPATVLPLVTVQPNPSSHRVAFELTTETAVSAATLNIVDVAGRVVRSIELRSTVPGTLLADWDTYDVGGQPVSRGMYTLSVIGPDGARIATGKVSLLGR